MTEQTQSGETRRGRFVELTKRPAPFAVSTQTAYQSLDEPNEGRPIVPPPRIPCSRGRGTADARGGCSRLAGGRPEPALKAAKGIEEGGATQRREPNYAREMFGTLNR